MRVTFLGTGTSQGVPMIGCHCVVCRSPDPRNKRLRPSIYVETGDGTCFVVDTTPDFRAQCLANNILRLDAVVITHTHADHIFGLDDVRSFNHAKGGLIPLFASAESMETLRRIFAYAFEPESLRQGWPAVEPHIIKGPFAVGSATLTPLAVPHGKAETLGFLVRDRSGVAFAYVTDAKEVPPEIEKQLRDIPLLILGALRYKPHIAHMTISEAVATAQRVRAAQTFFVHTTHQVEYAETNRQLPPDIRLAHDGLRLESCGAEEAWHEV